VGEETASKFPAPDEAWRVGGEKYRKKKVKKPWLEKKALTKRRNVRSERTSLGQL